jgi:RNA recognition motif-containing protein
MSSNQEENDSRQRFERNPDTTLFVGGIDEILSESDFLKAFEPFGKIVDYTLLSGKKFELFNFKNFKGVVSFNMKR